MRVIFAVVLATLVSVPVLAQVGNAPFYCQNTNSSMNVTPYSDHYVITLNIPVSQTQRGYMGEFYARLSQVRWSSQGVITRIDATSNVYQEGRWDERAQIRRYWRPGFATLTLSFTPQYGPQGLTFWTTGTLRQGRRGKAIPVFPGWCRPQP